MSQRKGYKYSFEERRRISGLRKEAYKRKAFKLIADMGLTIEDIRSIYMTERGKVQTIADILHITRRQALRVMGYLGIRTKNPSETSKGFKHSEESRHKVSLALIGNTYRRGKKDKPETLQRKRVAKQGAYKPRVNFIPVPFFQRYDEENNTRGFYGVNEYYIKVLGYFPDYINFEMKLIIEWDEEHHYGGGSLRKKDIQRQQEIQAYYPDFAFCRIRDRDIISYEDFLNSVKEQIAWNGPLMLSKVS